MVILIFVFRVDLFNKKVKVIDHTVSKTPPAAVLILQAANKKKGSDQPNLNKVASITWDQVKDIAETKMKDLNAFKISSAMKMIAGTARSMGVKVKGAFPENVN